MNHQVEHDVDVEASIGKGAEPVHFDEPRRGDQGHHGGDGRVVALRLAHGKRRAGRARGGDQLVSLGQRPRHRFLDQNRRAALEKRQRDVPVKLGGDRNGDGVHPAHDLAEVSVRRRPGRRRRRRGALRVRVDDRDELRPFQAAQDARVMPPEVPDANHGDTNAITRHADRSADDR